MLRHALPLRWPPLTAALASFLLPLLSCGPQTEPPVELSTLTEPAGLGQADTANVPDETAIPAYVDHAASNQRGDARFATLQTNAGVRVVAGFLDLWTPSTLLVDAAVTAPAIDLFPAITPSPWTGIPGDPTDGTVKNAAVLKASLQYVIDVTRQRTEAQAVAAYLDDRRGKGYSVTDGLGPLTEAWRSAAQQTTSITDVPADATTKKYDDQGNNTGVGGSANPAFGAVVDFVNAMSTNGSTEPAKRFFKYARPWRWSPEVLVLPALVPAKSSTPATDGSFISGHGAEATRDALAMAYLVPERFQELLARALELGENRILAGMHTPLDVIGGRIQAQAVVTANLVAMSPEARRAAVDQARSALMAATGTTDLLSLRAKAHSGSAATDRFADATKTRASARHRMTYDLQPIADTTKAPVVPKGAEVLLETRFPYLDAAQRRVVLKTTAWPSGYPVMDDAEGWGRLDYLAAADGFARLDGDVAVTMDASLGGFHAQDTWRNDVSGAGKLTKRGTGALTLSGTSSFSGGTVLEEGTLTASSPSALGGGTVFVKGGRLVCDAPGELSVGAYTHLPEGTLELHLGASGAGSLSVAGALTIAGGTLEVKLSAGFEPAVGETLDILKASSRRGRFSTVVLEGHTVTPVYTDTGLRLRIES